MDSQQSGVAFPSEYFTLPVYVAPEVTESILPAFHAAKETLHTDTLLKPQRAVVGSPGRVVAIGSAPPWACDWLGVKDLTDIDKLAHVISWAIFETEDDRAQGDLEFLRSIFGKEVQEIVG